MPFSKSLVVASLLVSLSAAAGAQAQSSSAATQVVVPAYGEVTHVNDEATLTFASEEQDQDKAAAAARVNQKMKEGIELVRRADPSARLKTAGYYTYPVYPDDEPQRPASSSARRVPVGWRVGQTLEVKTMNLSGLAKTAAAGQQRLQVNGVRFGLSSGLTKQLDDERIAATYRNLLDRIASIARAMGRKPSDAIIDMVDFEGSGNYSYTESARAASPARVEVTGSANRPLEMVGPTFEPGETTLQMRLVGKVKFR